MAVELVVFKLDNNALLDCELLREKEFPRAIDEVRSSNRVWYAKGPGDDVDLDPVEAFEDIESERSISWLRQR